MIRTSQRLVALLVILAMMAVGVTALAEEAKIPTTADIFARGNSLKADVDLQLNADTLVGLIAMTSSGPEPDPGQVAMINSIVNTITKLKTTALFTMEQGSIALGTEQGNVLNLYAKLEGEDVLAATSLLPGVHLKVPEEMLKAMVNYQATLQAPEIAAEALIPYGEAVTNYFENTVLPGAETQSQVEVPGVGTFATMQSFPITQGGVAGLVKAVNDVLREDTKMQEQLDSYLQSINSLNESNAALAKDIAQLPEGAEQPETTPKPNNLESSADLIRVLDEAIVELNQNPDQLLAQQRVYTDDQGNATYFETEVTEASDQVLVTVHETGKDDNVNLKVEVLVDTKAPSYGQTEPTPEPADKVDWQALKAGVLDGSKPFASYITLALESIAGDAELQSKMALEVRSQGMMMGLTSQGKIANQEEFAAEGSVTISAFSPEPLATLVYKMSEVAEKPEELPEGDKLVVLKEGELAEEDNTILEEASKAGMPGLMERVQTALPEEATVLIMLLQQFNEPQTTTTTTN